MPPTTVKAQQHGIMYSMPPYCRLFIYLFIHHAQLKEHRSRFLSNELVKQYISFAAGQVAQIKAKPQNNKKKIYNATRLLMEAKRLINGIDQLLLLIYHFLNVIGRE